MCPVYSLKQQETFLEVSPPNGCSRDAGLPPTQSLTSYGPLLQLIRLFSALAFKL